MLWPSNTPFSYSSLPPASTEVALPTDLGSGLHKIRLFHLGRPALRTKTPRCKLRTVELRVGEAEPMNAGAITYMHGSKETLKAIEVNGKRLEIAQNLYDCLEVLSKDGNRWGDIWADQICIDSRNIAERNRQVKHMGEVYRRASEVIVWLGRGIVADLVAVDLILKLYEWDRHRDEPTVLSPDERELLLSFVKHPVFERVWVAQELILARKIIVLVGDRELQWEVLIEVCSKHIFDLNIPSLRDVDGRCTSIQRLHMAKTTNDVLDIFDVIVGFCNYKCTDPRDHLFALLGLLKEGQVDKLSIKVDYSQSLYSVYCNFCWAMITNMPETDQLFDMLVMLGHAMGFEAVFYSDCAEDEILEFFRSAEAQNASVRAHMRNVLQAKTVQFQEAAKVLGSGERVEYDVLSGARIFSTS